MNIVVDLDKLKRSVGMEMFAQGEQCRNRGEIAWMLWDRPTMLAEVVTDKDPRYQVQIMLMQEGENWSPSSVRCSCPLWKNAWCPHTVAVMLAAEVDSEELLRERPLNRRIQRLSVERCRDLLMRLQENDEARFFIAGELSQDRNTIAASSDYEAIMRRVSEEVRTVAGDLSYQRHRPERAEKALAELEAMVALIRDRMDDGQSEEAVFMLLGLTGEIVTVWDTVDEEAGSLYGFFHDLSQVWLDAMMAARLLPKDRATVETLLKEWNAELSNYGIEALEVVVWVMEQGSDWIPVILEGEVDDPDFRTLVGRSWLRCLDRQGDDQGYLQYAQTMGLHLEHVCRLVQLKRVSDAISYSTEYLQREHDILTAVTEIARLDGETAFQYGVNQWRDLGDAPHLAKRLAEMAEVGGHQAELLGLHRNAWRADPSFHRYRRLKELWSGDWSELASELHAVYLNGYAPEEAIRVLASERHLDELIRVMEQAHGVSAELVREGVLALIPERAEWVVRFFQRRALAIMNEGRNGEYQTAALAAAYVRDAYRALDQEREWQAWKESIIVAHHRKYTLMPLIRPL